MGNGKMTVLAVGEFNSDPYCTIVVGEVGTCARPVVYCK